MADKSKIEWLDGGATWPVIRGCTKCSPGCDNCWAIRDAHLHAGAPNAKARAHFEGLTQITNGRPNWSGVVRLDESILHLPETWKKPRMVFVASSGDLFHERVTSVMLWKVFDVMRDAPQHTYLILTKRAEEMCNAVEGYCHSWAHEHSAMATVLPDNWLFGVSVEDEERARLRLPWLLRTPAARIWVSYEPAIGAVDWRWLPIRHSHAHLRKIDWIVIGGESGPGARPFNLDWARQTITQCKQAGVPCFMKQLGARPMVDKVSPAEVGRFPWFPLLPGYGLRLKCRKGSDMAEWPADLRVREYPTNPLWQKEQAANEAAAKMPANWEYPQ